MVAIRKRIRGICSCALAAWLAATASPVHAAVIIQLRVLEGEGAVSATGSRATRGLTVQVTDESGQPVEGATVSFTLPVTGPGGTFKSGLRSEVITTPADGKAAIWGMQWNRTPGPFEIRITASKDKARAGIVSTQYLNDVVLPKSGGGGQGTFYASHHSHTKWIVISVVAAGALAGVAFSRTSHTSSVASAPLVGLQIGSPSIIIGHP